MCCKAHNPSLLAGNGGSKTLGRKWTESNTVVKKEGCKWHLGKNK